MFKFKFPKLFTFRAQNRAENIRKLIADIKADHLVGLNNRLSESINTLDSILEHYDQHTFRIMLLFTLEGTLMKINQQLRSEDGRVDTYLLSLFYRRVSNAVMMVYVTVKDDAELQLLIKRSFPPSDEFRANDFFGGPFNNIEMANLFGSCWLGYVLDQNKFTQAERDVEVDVNIDLDYPADASPC